MYLTTFSLRFCLSTHFVFILRITKRVYIFTWPQTKGKKRSLTTSQKSSEAEQLQNHFWASVRFSLSVFTTQSVFLRILIASGFFSKLSWAWDVLQLPVLRPLSITSVLQLFSASSQSPKTESSKTQMTHSTLFLQKQSAVCLQTKLTGWDQVGCFVSTMCNIKDKPLEFD